MASDRGSKVLSGSMFYLGDTVVLSSGKNLGKGPVCVSVLA
jgi:hypothetical protein